MGLEWYLLLIAVVFLYIDATLVRRRLNKVKDELDECIEWIRAQGSLRDAEMQSPRGSAQRQRFVPGGELPLCGVQRKDRRAHGSAPGGPEDERK